MRKSEGRLSRWSRLKRQKRPENGVATDAPDNGDTGEKPEPAGMDAPGIIFRQGQAPMMAPLAGGDVADDDDRLSRPPEDASRFFPATDVSENRPVTTDGERPLTVEEQALVDQLPDLESLDKTSDFTPFMNDKIPAFIRRKALNVLWRSDSLLANLDGLNDYDEDFTIIETLVNAASDADAIGIKAGDGSKPASGPDHHDEEIPGSGKTEVNEGNKTEPSSPSTRDGVGDEGALKTGANPDEDEMATPSLKKK